MKALVTGAAGFIGSTLCERLLRDGHRVIGADCFTDYYDVDRKRHNAQAIESGAKGAFELRNVDLLTCDLPALLEGVDVVFHQAGQPGVPPQLGRRFRDLRRPERAGHAAAARGRAQLSDQSFRLRLQLFGLRQRCSLSRQGNRRSHNRAAPTASPSLPPSISRISTPTTTVFPCVSLRYFTVYGPRQRPDMATQRLVECAVNGREFTLFGDGSAERDFTFVDDIVDANVRAGTAAIPSGTVMNISGGSSVSMSELIALVGELSGNTLNIRRTGDQAGDVIRTGGDSSTAQNLLGWKPQTSLEEGVRRHLDWFSDYVS